MSQVTVSWAGLSEIERMVPLFDGYRQFYKLPSDLTLSRALLEARLSANQSKVALASVDGVDYGFMQFYPLFSSLASSVERSEVMLLNDLFVAPSERGLGVGKALLDFAADWARRENFGYMMLETAKTNLVAQGLYEKQGWKRDNEYFVYQLAVD